MIMDRIGRRQTYALGWSIVCVSGFIIGGAMQRWLSGICDTLRTLPVIPFAGTRRLQLLGQ
jgi:hypothetical protein